MKILVIASLTLGFLTSAFANPCVQNVENELNKRVYPSAENSSVAFQLCSNSSSQEIGAILECAYQVGKIPPGPRSVPDFMSNYNQDDEGLTFYEMEKKYERNYLITPMYKGIPTWAHRLSPVSATVQMCRDSQFRARSVELRECVQNLFHMLKMSYWDTTSKGWLFPIHVKADRQVFSSQEKYEYCMADSSNDRVEKALNCVKNDTRYKACSSHYDPHYCGRYVFNNCLQ